MARVGGGKRVPKSGVPAGPAGVRGDMRGEALPHTPLRHAKLVSFGGLVGRAAARPVRGPLEDLKNLRKCAALGDRCSRLVADEACVK